MEKDPHRKVRTAPQGMRKLWKRSINYFTANVSYWITEIVNIDSPHNLWPFHLRSRLYPGFLQFLLVINYQLLSMLKIKRDMNQQDFKIVDTAFDKSE